MPLNQTDIRNYSKNKMYPDNLEVLEKYKEKCHRLRIKNKEKYVLLQSLEILNKKICNTIKKLQEVKKEHESLKSELLKELFKINLDVDKQKILYRNRLNEYFSRKKKIEEQYQKCASFLELEDLVNRNKSLIENYESEAILHDVTKKQYNLIKQEFKNIFTIKVCEFCKIVLKLRALNSKVY